MTLARSGRDYAVVTAAYWVFTLTDGALRTLVLLHLHELGHSPLVIAALFLLYELCGVFTNLGGGWLGARFGLKLTLGLGLVFQVAACGLLSASTATLGLLVLGLAQGLSGIAKDLVKTSAKSYVKLVVPSGDGRGLMKLVALLTGSKNTLKGVGFFLGGFLLGTVRFERATGGMAVALVAMLALSMAALPRAPGKSSTTERHLLSKDPRVNSLSLARLFLFASRDAWFALALPLFLAALGWSHAEVGAALAVWVIAYGFVQASAPALLARGGEGAAATPLALLTIVPLAALAGALHLGAEPIPALAVGLSAFGLIFALNSALHSYLIVAFAGQDRLALDVGSYYAANAAGRFLGTALSGALYQWAGGGTDGLLAALVGAVVLASVSALLARGLGRPADALR